MTYIDGVLYCNTGDWVESCTAMVEDANGQLSIVHWADENQVVRDESDLKPHDGLRPPPQLDPQPALARVSGQIESL
jgi:hypothetical protein